VICRFLLYRLKGAIVNSVNSGVSGPNVTKIVHNVEKFILFNLVKLELRYRTPFRNGSDKVDSSEKTLIFYFNWLPWQRPLMNQKRCPDRSYSKKYLSFGAKMAKIRPVDPQIICLQLKKRNYRRQNSPVGRFAERAKQETLQYLS